MHRRIPRMPMGHLRAILLAFVLLFAPVSMAQASDANFYNGAVMEQGGRCAMIAKDSTAHRGPAHKTCCASTNIAVALALAGPRVREPLPHGPAEATTTAAPARFLGETATPPPRHF